MAPYSLVLNTSHTGWSLKMQSIFEVSRLTRPNRLRARPFLSPYRYLNTNRVAIPVQRRNTRNTPTSGRASTLDLPISSSAKKAELGDYVLALQMKEEERQKNGNKLVKREVLHRIE
jgi:hypothetical protein